MLDGRDAMRPHCLSLLEDIGDRVVELTGHCLVEAMAASGNID